MGSSLIINSITIYILNVYPYWHVHCCSNDPPLDVYGCGDNSVDIGSEENGMVERTAVVIRDAHLFNAGMRTLDALTEEGMPVHLLVLLDETHLSESTQRAIMRSIRARQVECLSCGESDLTIKGIQSVPIERVARMLKDVDFVVHF